MNPISAIALYFLTAVAEIAGCYAIYAWLRLGELSWWAAPRAMALLPFAYLLTPRA